MDPPFRVIIEVDRAGLQCALGECQRSDFEVMAGRIGVSLLGILGGGSDTRLLGDDWSLEDDALVRESLYDDRLQARYDAKLASVTPAFSSVDWEVAVRRGSSCQSQVGDADPFGIAVLRLTGQRVFADDAHLVLGSTVFESFSLELSVEELDHLSRVVLAARNRLLDLALS